MGNGRTSAVWKSRNIEIEERDEIKHQQLNKSTDESSTKSSSWGTNSIKDDNAYRQLQQQLGQSGFEAGDPNAMSIRKLYVKTSKAYNINKYLTTDGKTHKVDTINPLTGMALTNWHNLGYTERMVKNDIARIDSGMKPLKNDLDVTRYVTGDVLAKMIGNNAFDSKSIASTLNSITTNQASSSSLSNALKQVNYVHKAYTSTSWNTKNVFTDYDVKLEATFKAGTNVIATNNHIESEVLGAHGLKYNFTGEHRVERVKTSKGTYKNQLVLRVIIG